MGRLHTLKAAIAAAALAAACGGGGSDSGSPTTPTPGAPSSATITIGADGRVSPSSVTVALGSRVTFVNNHSVAHDMNSDPHPEHTACPEINVGTLQPGQSRQTQNLNIARTCGFHDHNRPGDSALQGSITIR